MGASLKTITARTQPAHLDAGGHEQQCPYILNGLSQYAIVDECTAIKDPCSNNRLAALWIESKSTVLHVLSR